MILVILLIIIIIFNIIIQSIEKYIPIDDPYINEMTQIIDYKKYNKNSIDESEIISYYAIINPYKLSIINLPKNIKTKLNSKYILFDKNNYDSLFYTDIFNYYINNKINVINTALTIPENKKTLLLIKQNTIKTEINIINNIGDLYNNKSVIGYYDDLDLLLFSYIYNIKLFNIKKIKLNNNYIDINTFKDNKIDVILSYIDLNNNILNFDPNLKLEFVDYENRYDKSALKLKLPFYISENIDLTVYFENFKNKNNPVRNCIQFNTIIYGNNKNTYKDEKKFSQCLNIILTLIGNFELINYYTQYFKFYDETIDYIEKKNHHILSRKGKNILEQFDNNKRTNWFNENNIIDNRTQIIKPKYSLKGFYDSYNNSFDFIGNNIENIPINENDIIILENQDRDEENGTYYVKYIFDNKVLLKKIKDTHVNKDDYYKGLNINYNYECINKPQIKTKGLCESEYTENNILKNNMDIWDKRCVYNTDCPFYQKNKNYKNYFGGCLDGYCQMPIGVKRIGYIKYDKNTKPLCYNCIITNEKMNNNDCCFDQLNKKLYPNLISPDYAFELDQYERNHQFPNGLEGPSAYGN